MQVIIDSRVADVEPKGTAAAIATQVAADHGILGRKFGLKIDGVVVTGALPKGYATVELVEVDAAVPVAVEE